MVNSITPRIASNAANKLGAFLSQPNAIQESSTTGPRAKTTLVLAPDIQDVFRRMVHTAIADSEDKENSAKKIADALGRFFAGIARNGLTRVDQVARRSAAAANRTEQIDKLGSATINVVKSLDNGGVTFGTDNGNFGFSFGGSLSLFEKLPDTLKEYNPNDLLNFFTDGGSANYILQEGDFTGVATKPLPKKFMFDLLLKSFKYLQSNMDNLKKTRFNPELDPDYIGVKQRYGHLETWGSEIAAIKQQVSERCETTFPIFRDNVILIVDALTRASSTK